VIEKIESRKIANYETEIHFINSRVWKGYSKEIYWEIFCTFVDSGVPSQKSLLISVLCFEDIASEVLDCDKGLENLTFMEYIWKHFWYFRIKVQ
jgi:hypothetical protein